ncbi:fibrous sheath CABYR-binding protein-like [Penaeus japonicus]|uniref:fibrous sheath CABYR-binding protein-like n=1 Tax=Penaeus japonicus TaxID=27405 RepID=UPI001C70CDCA|nr:fibrous sheath CABYR-binding protein-like [Penaeus japonicus]XP_042859786.1 fibrous sheath CABYR-binding protein-like [Penaeus japonicus]XP_042859787.1 fibrous sheath CABYR-binding protein-like [Penaeus japonicus]
MTSHTRAPFLLGLLVLGAAVFSLAHARPEELVDLDAFPQDPHMLEEFEEVVTSAPYEEEVVEEEEEGVEEEGLPRPYPVHDVYPKKVTDETYPKKFQEGLAAQEGPVAEPDQAPEEPLAEEEAQPEAPGDGDALEDQVEETASPQPEVEEDIPEEPVEVAAEEEPQAPAEEAPEAVEEEEEEATMEEEAAAEEEPAMEEETAVEEDPEAEQSARSDVEEDGGPLEYQPEPAAEESGPQEYQPEPEEPARNETQVEQPADAQEPVVMPVTEGKNRSGQDAVSSFDLPKELMPIHPGGGSKFEDLEQERLDKTKMSQTKVEDEASENENAHNAEGLYSSCSALHAPLLVASLVALLGRTLV